MENRLKPEDLERTYGVPFVELSKFSLNPTLIKMFDEHTLRKLKFIPLFKSGNTLVVAMVNPSDVKTIDEIARMTNMEIEPMVCDERELHNVLNSIFTGSQPTTTPVAKPSSGSDHFTVVDIKGKATDDVEKIIADELESKYGVPFVRLSDFMIEPSLVKMFSEDTLRRLKFIPLFKSDNVLTIAMVNPLDIKAIDEIRRLANMDIETMVCEEEDLEQTLNTIFSPIKSESRWRYISADELKKQIEEEPTISEKIEVKPEPLPQQVLPEVIAEDAEVIRYINDLLTRAVRERASDLHIEHTQDGLAIRIRVDGILHPMQQPPSHIRNAIIPRIKVMSNLNIAEHRIPQDGRCSFVVDGKEIDLRVSTLPTIYGESAVIRILDKSIGLLSTEELGLSPNELKLFEKLLSIPYGMILVTGPTGSGKTTTLYAILRRLISTEKNIVTIEDPVEYRIPGIRQTQVNIRAGYTFANGLRAILRQDPDIVMVGEIRDKETANIAVHAALTGHLVLSTLHTNDAPGALPRLIDMGVEPFLVASSVVGVIAQRLVRKICPRCREPFTPTPELIKAENLPDNVTLYRGKGCNYCRRTGYRGRTGIFQIMLVDDKIRNLVVSKAPASEIERAAAANGMLSLRESGMQKVLEGITTLEEVLRVTQ